MMQWWGGIASILCGGLFVADQHIWVIQLDLLNEPHHFSLATRRMASKAIHSATA
jgi:hypothetical protein